MKIFQALGFGLTLVMLKFLVPEVFKGFESLLLTFFQTLSLALGATQKAMTATSLFAIPPN